MDIRNRRLDTAKRVMEFMLDAKRKKENYESYLEQLETMKREYGIHYDIKNGRVFYPK
jgi:hypothetical protein